MRLIAALACVIALAGCRQSGNSEQKSAEKAAPAAPAPISVPKVNTEGFPKTVNGRVVLATVPAGDAFQYEVAIGECVKDECPVLVSLLDAGGKVIDQAHTEWASNTRNPEKEELKPGWGVGDPTGPPSDLTAWATGEEEKYLGTAIRAVALAPSVVGLLIDQRTGFEHVKRRHEIFAAVDGKMVRLWDVGEGAGPAVTSTAIIKLPGGAEGVAYYDGFRYPVADRPDTLTVRTLAWDAQTRKLVDSKEASGLPAVVISGFGTIQAARQFRSKQSACLGSYWVLPATQFTTGSDQTGFVLAMPSASQQQAETKRAEASRCAENRKPIVVPMH